MPTLSLICNIVDPITKEEYSRDPRNIARKAEAYLKSTGIGDIAYFGPEPEFFIFDDVRYDQNAAHRLLLRSTRSRGSGTPAGATKGGEPRLQAALQGRLLPGRPDRLAAGHPRRDGAR